MTQDTQPLTAWEIELGDSLLVDVDLAKDVPCAWQDCPQVAVWVMTNKCCGLENQICDPHKTITDQIHEDAGEGDYLCRRCRAVKPGYTWRPL